MIRSLWKVFLFFLIVVGCSLAQTSAPADAAVIFTLDFPQSTPSHYSIQVDSLGKANYTSEETQASPGPDQNSDASPYHYEFSVSPETRERIFDLAARAKYFSGNVDSGKRNLANTGTKTLAYKDLHRTTEAKFNYSTNPAVQQLTTLFQNLGSTLEFGERLDYAYRYQKLALDEQLKSMTDAARQNNLLEIQAVAPILKKIIADHTVMNVTRARAERLLAQSSVASNGSH